MRNGSLAIWPFAQMCLNRVAWGDFLWVPPVQRIVDINSYSWGRGLEQLIDVALSLVLQLS